MAKTNELPGFKEKRKVLFGDKVSDEERFEMGCELMDSERFDDALEFFARTDEEGVEQKAREIAKRAMEAGNTPLFLRAKTILKEDATADELEKIARTALSNDSPYMALTAYKKGGMGEKAETLQEQIFGSPKQKETEDSEPDDDAE